MLLSPGRLSAAVIAAVFSLVAGGGVAVANTNVNLAIAANVDAIANTGSAVANGGFDKSGNAYAAALLGKTVTWSSVSFTLGVPGTLNATSGSTFSLPTGNYSELYMLAAANNGNQPNQTFVVTYTDGTTSTFTQGISDWFIPQHYAGETTVLTEAYRLDPSGVAQSGPYHVYGYTFALNGAKTIKSVALPRNRSVVVLALTLGSSPAQGVSVPFTSNVDGIATSGSPVKSGGLDGHGNAFSSALMGTTATWSGVNFVLGQAGQPNAVSGSTLASPAGSFTSLRVLATGVNGDQANQIFVVTYTDGTSTKFTQSLSDWLSPQHYAGETTVLTEAYRLGPSGASQSGPYHVYGYAFSLNSAKTVKSVTLPGNRSVVVLALSLVSSAAGVSVPFESNVDGIATSGSPVKSGGLDGYGNAYSSALMGTTATWAGTYFSLGQAGQPDAVSGATLSLPAGSYGSLRMLATGVNGNQANQIFVVTYTDGTSTRFTQSLSDWLTPQHYAGETMVLTEANRVGPSGAVQNRPFYVYGYTFALNSTKTLKSVALPSNRHVVVLAVTLGASAPLGSSVVQSTPSAPTNLAARGGTSQVGLGWTASAGATAYQVKRSTVSGGPYTQVGSPTGTSYTDASVTNGTMYFYVVAAMDSAGESANSAQVSASATAPPPVTTPPPTKVGANCGMNLGGAAIFCETFDAPAATVTRSGQLDNNVWGVSRLSGDGVNFGQNWYNLRNPTPIDLCDGTTPTVLAPHDVQICNGQVREATNDNNSGAFEAGTVTVLAMYPKQPFDFAGRTGTVSFDVSNDGAPHGAWPEFWMSDAPVPAPFAHGSSWETMPANGFGVRLNNVAPIGQQGECPNQNNPEKIRWTVDSAIVSRNYVADDTLGFGTRSAMSVTDLDCVIASSGPGNFNHVELRISQNQIDVYATDAGVAATPSTLKHIAVINNVNLTFTRGLIWLEDVHYNGDKINDPTRPSQAKHTFSWDNVAFDGAFTDRDFTFDGPDNTLPGPNGAVNLGKFSLGNLATTWNVPGLPANPSAKAAKVLFNFFQDFPETVINVTVNGHAHSVPWPYPDHLLGVWRTYALTIPLTDLVAGTNVVQLGTDAANVFSNVDIVLAGVTGGVPVLPGSNNGYPP